MFAQKFRVIPTSTPNVVILKRARQTTAKNFFIQFGLFGAFWAGCVIAEKRADKKLEKAATEYRESNT